MERPLIAIVGNAAGTVDPELAKRAARELGAELARRNCRIMVFSTMPAFIEWEAVQGYLGSGAKKVSKSIEVRYPPKLDGRFPGEQADDPLFVRSPQGGDWEASIFPAFANIDGLVLIGGARTTKIAGLLAVGSRTPLIALGGMGGAAQEIWTYLKGDRNTAATDDDLNLMAMQRWSENSAARFVDALLGQRRRKLETLKLAVLGQSERRRRRFLTLLALIGCAIFAIVLLVIVESHAGQLTRLQLWMLFGTPALAGASGALIRVLWDNWEKHPVALGLHPVAMTVALGFWAGGVAGALFLLPQTWILDTLDNNFMKLSGFAIPIGLLAGLTLDKVFPKLIKINVPITMPRTEDN
jgi:hypothetical protein